MSKLTSYEIITNQIIDKLNEGVIPWVKPWHANSWKCEGMSALAPAYSYSNGKRYNFMNQMLLDFAAGEYATFQQIKKDGGKVKKGEHGRIVAGWIVETKPVEDANGEPIRYESGEPMTRTTYALRYYTVFNILTQVEGLTPKHTWTFDESVNNDLQPEAEAETIINNYIKSANAPKFEIVNGSAEAYYRPSTDTVVVPHMSQFDEIAEYYSTAFHELTHSTGTESRCNRKLETKKAAFGSASYSKEELVAEMGSCFLNTTAGLQTESSFRNSAAYLQGWLKALKDDPKLIIHASAQAEKATEYILNAKPVNEPDKGSKADAPKKSKTNVKKAFEYVAKRAAKNIQGTSGKCDGVSYACDTHQMIKTTEEMDVDALDKADAAKSEKMLADYIKQCEKSGKLDVTAKEVREGMKLIKNGKRGAKVMYTLDEGITLNADYLLNALTATAATEYLYIDAKHPVVFRNETTTYMLCPINSKVELDKGFKLFA